MMGLAMGIDAIACALLAAAPAADPPGGLFSDRNLQGLVACAAVFALILVLVRHTARRPRVQQPEPIERTRPGPHQPLRGETERLLVELGEFGREVEGRIETRIHHLTALIAEADRAVERLSAALASVPGAGAPAAQRPEADPQRERIVALAAEGNDAAEIARIVGVPVGEVALVLEIERRAGPCHERRDP
jgi:hypothetical protein